MISKSKALTLKKNYRLAIIMGHRADLALAQVGLGVIDSCEPPDPTACRIWIRENLEVANRRASLIYRMGDALLKIPNTQIWIAGGWPAVRDLVKRSKRQREKIARALVKEHDRLGRRLGERKYKALVKDSIGHARAPLPTKAPRHPGQEHQIIQELLGVIADLVSGKMSPLTVPTHIMELARSHSSGVKTPAA